MKRKQLLAFVVAAGLLTQPIPALATQPEQSETALTQDAANPDSFDLSTPSSQDDLFLDLPDLYEEEIEIEEFELVDETQEVITEPATEAAMPETEAVPAPDIPSEYNEESTTNAPETVSEESQTESMPAEQEENGENSSDASDAENGIEEIERETEERIEGETEEKTGEKEEAAQPETKAPEDAQAEVSGVGVADATKNSGADASATPVNTAPDIESSSADETEEGKKETEEEMRSEEEAEEEETEEETEEGEKEDEEPVTDAAGLTAAGIDGNSRAGAYSIAIGNKKTGTFTKADCQDYYKFDVKSDMMVAVTISGFKTPINIIVSDAQYSSRLYMSRQTCPKTYNVFLTKGTYYVYLNGNSQPGSYTIQLATVMTPVIPTSTIKNSLSFEQFRMSMGNTGSSKNYAYLIYALSGYSADLKKRVDTQVAKNGGKTVADGWCTGLVYTSILMNTNGSGLKASDYRAGATKPSQLAATDMNENLYLTLEETVAMLQMSRSHFSIDATSWRGMTLTAKMAQLANELKQNRPMAIALSWKINNVTHAHAVLAYGYQVLSASESRILIYDPNFAQSRYIRVYTKNGQVTGIAWPYTNAVTYTSQNHQLDMEFTPVDAITAMWSKLGNLDDYSYHVGSKQLIQKGNTLTPTAIPNISKITTSGVSSSGYTVTVEFTCPGGVKEVLMPTWTEKDGQDDIVWHKATVSGNKATFAVKTSAHKNESGKYYTHVYVYGNTGRRSAAKVATVTVPAAATASTATKTTTATTAKKLEVSSYKVTNLTKDGFTITVNCSAPNGISKVQLPTWTEKNGQDDLVWHEAKVSGNTATFTVKTSQHKNETGKYITHIYLYDKKGARAAIVGFTTTVPAATAAKTTTAETTAATKTTPSSLNTGSYSAVFNAQYYLNKYADLKKAFGNDEAAAFNHFKNYGMKEGRQGIATFNVQVYKNRYPDLQKAFGNNLKLYYEHFMNYGQKEGRKGN